MNEKFCILIRISFKFLPEAPIDSKSSLVQVMVWRRTGDKPVSEAMLNQIHWRIYAALGGDGWTGQVYKPENVHYKYEHHMCGWFSS